ncbi:protein kinase [Streptomyces sp. NPDC051561]|uniref:serine/threonine-protein kinase n=1 Tax=Streptomyces sp. NPDC051561 TaxID=3365658 RepID=UPI0037AFFAB3
MATGENERLAGRYRVIEQLGRGGMGVVWRAEDEVLGREVAVKELRTYNDASGPELADLQVRMQREARAAARIRHPGVIAVHDIADHEGRPLIVMELVDGPSLDGVLTDRGLLDPREAASIGAKVLEALGAAHRVGVLHRDVKPGNILLDSGGRVVLTDFGIAAIDDPGDGSSTHLTRSGELVGSLDYLAPERAQGQAPGPASDIWALGATLYAAVEGGSPFRRTSTWSTLNAIVVEPLPDPVRSGPLAPVLRALMAKDPAERPDAAQAARLLTDVAESAPAPSASERLPPAQGGFGPATSQPSTPAPYGAPPSGFGPPTPPVQPGYGAVPQGYGTGAGPTAGQQGYGTGPTPSVGQPAYGTGPTSSGGSPFSGPGPAATGTVGSTRREGASGGRRRALVTAGVAAVLLTGAGVTYALGDRGDDGKAVGSPAANSSDSAGSPTAEEPLTPGALPTDAAKKTQGPTPTGKDKSKGKDDPGKKPSPTPGGGKSTGAPTTGGNGSTTAGGSAATGGTSGSGGGSTSGSSSTGGATTTGGGGNPPPPAPAPVCNGIGGGKYHCNVWRTSDSIRSNGERAGTLNAGTNYFYCQANLGRRVTYGNWTNVWWAKTDDDSGNTNVYVSVVYLKGGDNDKPLPGLPAC